MPYDHIFSDIRSFICRYTILYQVYDPIFAGTIIYLQVRSYICRYDPIYLPVRSYIFADTAILNLPVRSYIFAGTILYLQVRSYTLAGTILYLQVRSYNCRYNPIFAGTILYLPVRSYICRYYPCCSDLPYPDLTFTVRLKRVAIFYNYILILPCVLLSFLTLVIFWLPPESPAKMMLGKNK